MLETRTAWSSPRKVPVSYEMRFMTSEPPKRWGFSKEAVVEDVAGLEVDEVHGDGGGTDVGGDAEDASAVAVDDARSF